eukprot:607242-Amphidinium_carterae.1
MKSNRLLACQERKAGLWHLCFSHAIRQPSRFPHMRDHCEADEYYYMKNSENNKITAAKSSMAVITTSRVEAETATSMEIDLGVRGQSSAAQPARELPAPAEKPAKPTPKPKGKAKAKPAAAMEGPPTLETLRKLEAQLSCHL